MKRLIIAVIVAGAVAGGALAYFTSSGSGSASASVATLSTPANPAAALAGVKIKVTWDASTIAGSTAATSYTVERFTDTGTDLGAATCSPVSSASGNPDAFGSFSCLDASGAGTFEYKVTAHYSTAWTATSDFTNSVTAASSTTTLSSSANPSVTGQEVTYAATVTGSPAGTPTGDVEFLDGATPIAGCTSLPLSASAPYQATCDPAYTASGGSHSITARYLGDGNYPESTSSALTQDVNKADTTTAVSSDHNPSVSGQQVTYTATVVASAPGAGTPGGTVTFSDGGSPIAACTGVALSGGQATCRQTYGAAGGGQSITVSYAGDADYNGSSTASPLAQTVDKADTTTAVTSGTNPSVTGQPVTFTATISITSPGAGTPTGTVSFEDGGTTIGGCGSQTVSGGQATCTVSGGYLASGGNRTISAVYSGDTNLNGSTSAGFTQTVNKADTTTAVVSSVNPSVTGQQVTFTATVAAGGPGTGTPGGTVTFGDAGSSIAGCAGLALVSGQATCNQTYGASGGSHSITVSYSGSGDYNASSTASALTQTVNKASTTTSVVSSANPSVSGQQVTYTASVAASVPGSGTPGGTVTFSDGGSAIAACTNVALVSGSATCPQTYAGVGSHSITVSYSGSGDFNGSSTAAALTQTVNKASTSTGVVSSANASVTGQSVTYTATVSVTSPGAGTPTGTVNFKDGASTISGCGGQTVTSGQATCTISGGYLASGGSHTITATYSGDTSFNGSTSSSLTQTVSKDGTTTIVTSSADPSVTGQQVTYTATVSAGAPGSGIPGGTVTFLDGGTNIGGCVNLALSSGQATCSQSYSASGGGHSVTVSYAGSGDYTASTSTPAIAQTVNAANTSTAVTSSANPSLTGSSVTYTATVTASAPGSGTPAGSVAFLDNGTAISGCAAVALNGSGRATCTSPAYGTVSSHPITAQYGGSANYNGSTSSALTQNVNSSAVVGLGIVKTGGTGSPVVSCGTPSASYTCNVSGTGSGGSVTFTVTFVNSSGTATVYSTQSSTVNVSGFSSGSVAIPGGASSSSPSTLTAGHSGGSTKTSTLTFGSFTLTINVSS